MKKWHPELAPIAVCRIVIAHFLVAWTILGTGLSTASALQIQTNEKIVAIGDIHGDAHALIQVLEETKLINKKGQWTGGQTLLVLVGDILDRGQNSRMALDTIMRLEDEAKKAGGQVITLLGNHEAMVLSGDYRYFTLKDAENYFDFKKTSKDKPKDILRQAFSADSIYGQWIASLPTMAIINDLLFVHAGVEKWLIKYDTLEINSMVTDWMQHYIGAKSKPKRKTNWVIDDRGPLWTRKAANGHIPPASLKSWLDQLGIRSVVVGHTLTTKLEPQLSHPVYGDRFVMIDSALSSAYGVQKKLFAVEWTDEVPRVVSFKRRPHPNGVDCRDLLYKRKNTVE